MLLLFFLLLSYNTRSTADTLSLEFKFFGDSIHSRINDWHFVDFGRKISSYSIQEFYDSLNQSDYQPIINTLLAFKEKNKLDDWLYYQLIRKAAQQISPKSENYNRYTLYKWFLLNKSGYNASLAIRDSELLFYAQSNDNIYDIPYYFKDGRQFVCLNLHDFGRLDFEEKEPNEVAVKIPEGKNPFTYRITSMPEFSDNDYAEKDIQFDYKNKAYLFKVKVNSQIQSIFANYPVVDYESYFNIPLSKETYNSLIPELKEQVKGMNQKNGVDYLMRFTRNAFSYENDQQNFGKEKRLSPEQTLLNKYSDCDDRAALFFCLVKEIYNLPMIVLAYPTHVTIAVKFDKSVGKPIMYKNKQYSVCEPTPQTEDLSVGQLSSKLKDVPFQVAYEYDPQH
ncbi:hypothetical protein F0919_04400 [Taibaiella lutea]|uniref:Transglutaminase domain-containing protein n=1 Tax=Taibaiella lutea TaxID=2608001 RepID=A0A5M6CQR7_9BACT|nr:hypothetical protein F0919_04400 [Taibaiella lutea]